MISKQIINAGLTSFYPVVVLSDERDNEVTIDRDDYTNFRINEGMNDQEIMKFAGVV